MNERRRCAIYTRKSTDEGLEQNFNSLDAQREACEAFIQSQRHEGWRAISAKFDDGGFSGGTMKRPALTRLLDLAKSGQIDVVVVYKVDRLTRSLADFAKIVELFDAHGVSFVSVTQQFNTTSSMGRLTLNVLLSFAQFEREVTGERIRDKIAASKKKGMWMGGTVPLGYDLRARELVINAAEAEAVRTLFRLYRELGTVRQLKEASDRLGFITKPRVYAAGASGGEPFTRGHLYYLLTNRIYVGEVTHKGASYPGRQEAIIDRALFEAVQHQLGENGVRRSSGTNVKAPSLLTGLVRDETGDLLGPTHASKKGRRYRYYVSKRLVHPAGPSTGGWRLPAKELETAVLQAIRDFLRNQLRLVAALQLNDAPPDRLTAMIERATSIAEALRDGSPRELISDLVHAIILNGDAMRIEIDRRGLARALAETEGADAAAPFALVVPIRLKRRGVEAKLILQLPREKPRLPDRRIVALVTDAFGWIDDLAQGRVVSLREIARRDGVDVGDVSRAVPLAFLAPDIVEAILEGRQPIEVTAHHLKRLALPNGWNDQRRRLGFLP